MIRSVKLVTIPTRDQDRALAFYTEKLGFRLITDQPFGPGQRWIELGIGHSETGFVLFTPPGEEDKVPIRFNGSLDCDDVEATYRQLSERGVEFESPPTKQPWGRFAIMIDSEGNRFVLSSRS
ncbi:MAG TPA: VOC family protein [Rhizomicrobium sp.]|jgi:predicted enzyme related to lactoylglutathione lyase